MGLEGLGAKEVLMKMSTLLDNIFSYVRFYQMVSRGLNCLEVGYIGGLLSALTQCVGSCVGMWYKIILVEPQMVYAGNDAQSTLTGVRT